MALFDKTYAQSKYNLTPTTNRKTKHLIDNIVVHYTGTTASAKNNCIYFGSGNRNASADFFIDTDGKIYKFNKRMDLWYSWHCGDGGGRYGITNARSIGIEVVSAGADYTSAQKKALRKLIRWLRKYYKQDIPVVRHYDASRKTCPAPYAGSAAKDKKWQELLGSINDEYKATSDTYAYTRRYFGKKYRGTKIAKGERVHIVATFKGAKYLWGELPDGTWINISKRFKKAA